MESCLNYKPERVGAVTVEDLKKDLFVEFSKIPVTQDSVLLQKEHLQVYLRIRPFTSTESEFGESQDYISVEDPDTVILKAPRFSLTARQSERLGPQLAQRFQFSKVYGSDTTQRQMFEGTTKALVKDVLGGENSLVFTYGVTNAGKTFTFLGPDSDAGILPRSLNVIFNSIEGRIYTQNIIKPHRCIDFTRLTKDQQEEDAKIKKNLLRRFKESDQQKSSSSMSSSASSTLLEASSYSDLDGESFCLEADPRVKFSVWVSFCEIYNENIHDLLDFSSSSQRRSALRLCQDIKGNAFVKDLTWIQVNGADEAYRVLKIGRKNQSFSSTKLNSVSSRSHSIFSIRILRIEDMAVPRVQSVSELALCDLAGSERCAKTQNRGERLKEAGNINTSLLTLGKCMHALRLSQTQSKFQQHIPFRESKLTHYLQGFFCGRGKACMIVNINQSASMYDETLNVLKFSALAQKVVVLNPKPVVNAAPKKSARDVSMMINNVDRREWSRRSTLIGWESSLEDVQEDEDDEDMEEDEEDESMVENTVLETAEDEDLSELQQQIKELKEKLSQEQSDKLNMESRIRDEVTAEFMELFANMEKDYNERLEREKEIAEGRAERRLEILKNLVNKTASELEVSVCAEDGAQESKMELLDGMIEAMQNDMAKIKRDAEAAQSCLGSESRSEGAEQNYDNQKEKCQKLMDMCQEKDEMISKLQSALDQNVEVTKEDRAFIDTIKEEILLYRNNCKCLSSDGQKEQTKDEELKKLLQTVQEKDELLKELRHDHDSLRQKLKGLSDDLVKQRHAWEAAVSSLETEKAETGKLTDQNRALRDQLAIFQREAGEMKSKLRDAETRLEIQTAEVSKLSEELQAERALLQERAERSNELTKTIESLKLECEDLRQKLHEQQTSQSQENNGAFQKTIDSLRRECETMLANSMEKSRRILSLEQEVSQVREEIGQQQNLCDQLKQERDAQTQEKQELQSRYQAERLSVEQMRRSCQELEAQLEAAREQMMELKSREQSFMQNSERERELQEKLEEKEQSLLQIHNQLEQSRRTEEEKRSVEISREREEKKKQKELEAKAQELLQSRRLVDEGLETIRSLNLDLKQKEEQISELHAKLTEASTETKQLQGQVSALTGEIRTLQQNLRDLETDRDQALNNLTKKEQLIKELEADQCSQGRSDQMQQSSRVAELVDKERLIEELHLTLSDRERTEQQQLLEQRLNEMEPLRAKLMKLKEKDQKEGGTAPSKSHQDQQETENTTVQIASAGQDVSVLSTASEGEKRFPKPQLEISFTPLKPDQLNLRRPGDADSVTVKIKRTGRKRKSAETQNSVESENRKNMRLRGHSRAESPSVLGKMRLDSPVILMSRVDGPLQRIGDFIQSSPTILGSKAKKIMAKVVVKSPEPQITEISNKPKRSKRKLFKTQISSPLDIPSHPIIGIDQDEKESDHLIIKRKLRTRTTKK